MTMEERIRETQLNDMTLPWRVLLARAVVNSSPLKPLAGACNGYCAAKF